MNPAAVILAAGQSARMGQPKQLLELGGKSLLRRTLDAACGASENVLVVLGAHAEAIQATLEPSVQTTVNTRWAEGMGASISHGVETLLKRHPDTDSVLLLVCDQPLIHAGHLRRLIAEQAATGREIVASRYDGTPAVPALFGAHFFPKLLALSGDRGARHLFQTHAANTATVLFIAGELDLDTPEDVARWHCSFPS